MLAVQAAGFPRPRTILPLGSVPGISGTRPGPMPMVASRASVMPFQDAPINSRNDTVPGDQPQLAQVDSQNAAAAP